jgi:hypothetical protein
MVSAIREELDRLTTIEERHRRLASRLTLLFLATLLVDLLGAVAFYALERSANGTQVTTFGQALFFTTAQVLTVSSSLANPVTPVGRVVDLALELWGVVVVAGSAGALATFFFSSDRS